MNPTMLVVIFLSMFAVTAIAISVAWNVSERTRQKKLARRLHMSLEQIPEADSYER